MFSSLKMCDEVAGKGMADGLAWSEQR